MTCIGIDFGTTNSVVSVHTPSGLETLPIDEPPADWAELGFDKVLPTVFGVGPAREPVFGWAAKKMTQDKVEAVKRLFRDEETVTIGGQSFLVEEIATLLFAHMKRKAQQSGIDPKKCVVTVPANSRGLARYRTKLTAAMAGMEVLALVNEPTAAAMAHSAYASDDQRLLVVDWGGGTLDVTILQATEGIFIEQASKGIQQLGGLDFDARFAATLREGLPESQRWSSAENAEFRLAVERAKVLLSSQEFTNLPLPGGGYRRVERREFEQSVRSLVERVRQPVQQCLRDIAATPSEIDAVILVGGTCNIPLVRDAVADIMAQEPAVGVNPMTAVAEGAALAAAIMTGDLEDNDFFVGIEHALGTFVHDQMQRKFFSTIIPRNHKLPARARNNYLPLYDDAEELLVSVVEGDPELPVDHEDNVVLREVTVPLPEGATAESKRIEITYEYDLDGILHVTVTHEGTGRLLTEDEVSFGVGADKKSLVDMARRVGQTIESDTVHQHRVPGGVDAASADLLQRARTKVLPFLDGDEARGIRDLIARVETTTGAEQTRATRELDDALVAYSYLF